MEENERAVSNASNENTETNEFIKELVDFPHIIDYIQKLQEQLKLQQKDINNLKDKLKNYEEPLPTKSFKDSETQYDLLEIQEPLAQDWLVNNDKKKTIADQVTEAAESAMLQTGFVYEETTGLYYHCSSGYYYDPKSGLYYDGNSGIYYYYDKESKAYKFYSQIQIESNELKYAKESINTKKKEKDRIKKVKLREEGVHSSASEEGECSETDDEESSSSKEDNTKSSSGNNSETEIKEARAYPPCMRIIVKETNLPDLKVGTLFIVTYTGGSLGREGDHSVLISDINISKYHAKIQYNNENKLYEIIDLGSRNGTFLNGKRLSAAKQESEVTKIVHGTILQVGSTKLLCHVHIGHDTCGHCEPGLLLSDPVVEENSVSIKTRYQTELKRLKSKFGIEDDATDLAYRIALGYQDRARLRRENVGSSSDHFKVQQSSLNESISKDNMGFKLLMKMGWTEGNCLGKRGDGVTEPITLVPVFNKAGFGSNNNPTDQVDPNVERKAVIRKKTRQRFNKIKK